MKSLVILLVLSSLILYSCRSNDSNKTTTLEQRLTEIDTLVARHKLTRQRLIKRTGSNQLTIYHPRNDNQPIDTIYAIWRNNKGNIKLTGTYPNSQSGDWVIAYLHYFDDAGHTFAFRQNTRFFSSDCTDNVDDIINEDVRTYYDTSFNKIDSTYALTHDQSIVIDPDSCQNPYSYFKYQPSKNLQNYLKRIHYDNTINNTDSTHAH